MSAPLMPPLLDQVGRRRFAFYPSIANADPNEWVLSGMTWADVRVVNARSGNKISIPRQYLAAVSETDDPILIVGLTKELEYREGAVWPRVKRVIEFPLAANDYPRPFSGTPNRVAGPAQVVGIRLERAEESRTGKMFVAAGISAVVLSVVAVGVLSDWVSTSRIASRITAESLPLFTAEDDHASIARQLGPPDGDRWIAAANGDRLEALAYPGRGITVVLFSAQGGPARYLGILNRASHIIHSVGNGPGLDTASLLASVPRF